MNSELKRLTNELKNRKFLDLLNESWESHSSQINLITQLLTYLETGYASKIKPLVKVGNELFRQIIIENSCMKGNVLESILKMIKRDREGDTIDRALLKNVLRMLTELQLYDQFEVFFLEETKKHYEQESREKIEKINLPEYLQYVEIKRTLETERVLHYLDNRTKKPLLQLTEQEVIQVHVEELLIKGFDELMEENNLLQLSLLFTLFSKVAQTEPINLSFGTYCKRVGLELVNDQQKEDSLILQLLQLKSKLSTILEQSFQSHPSFKESLRVSPQLFFFFFINLHFFLNRGPLFIL